MKEACAIIAQGGTAIFPTDTVYGIGCNPYDKSAVQKIYRIKQREQEKPFPVLAFSTDELHDIAFFDPVATRIADRFWPGQVTMILRLKDKSLQGSLGIKDEIAVRVPSGSCIRDILEKCRFLVGTSANPSGIKPFIDPKECMKNITGYDVFVDGGMIKGGKSSTIIDLTGGVTIKREGIITSKEIIETVWN